MDPRRLAGVFCDQVEIQVEDFIRTFQISAQDLEVIEESLLSRRRELERMRASLDNAVPAEFAVLQVVARDLEHGDELLQRLQDMMSMFSAQSASLFRLQPIG